MVQKHCTFHTRAFMCVFYLLRLGMGKSDWTDWTMVNGVWWRLVYECLENSSCLHISSTPSAFRGGTSTWAWSTLFWNSTHTWIVLLRDEWNIFCTLTYFPWQMPVMIVHDLSKIVLCVCAHHIYKPSASAYNICMTSPPPPSANSWNVRYQYSYTKITISKSDRLMTTEKQGVYFVLRFIQELLLLRSSKCWPQPYAFFHPRASVILLPRVSHGIQLWPCC